MLTKGEVGVLPTYLSNMFEVVRHGGHHLNGVAGEAWRATLLAMH